MNKAKHHEITDADGQAVRLDECPINTQNNSPDAMRPYCEFLEKNWDRLVLVGRLYNENKIVQINDRTTEKDKRMILSMEPWVD